MSKGEEPINLKNSGRKLTSIELDFMKVIEKQNLERVQKLKKVRKNNFLTAIALGSGVLGIYFYSMYTVKQEKFLDDFIEPEKISTE